MSARTTCTLSMLLAAELLPAETVAFKQRCLDDLVAQAPAILASQDRASGRFGTGIWIVTDQNLMLPLAAAWSYKAAANPYYHRRELLEAVMAAGDALIADQDETGQWEFRKKDGSTWGKTYMPWTYSRWIRSFALIREAMPPERRAKWEKALLLGYSGISAKELNRIHNIPAHHAMGLYFAGQVFQKPAWRQQAAEFLRKVAAAQHPDGYWREHNGPVVNYGLVYVDALGIYFAASEDKSVLPVLRKSGVFHSHFTYPDGAGVETIDERNPYEGLLRAPGVGFTFTREGRSYVARQLRLRKGPVPADDAAALLLWGEEGEGAEGHPRRADFDFVLGKGDAAIYRRGPWFLVVSAFTAPVPTSRWAQDRQNFVSVFHEKAGLILGGGNTKLQPGWSTFTRGDTSLLQHKPGDESPNFLPPAGLLHVPTAARLLRDNRLGVELEYGEARGEVRLNVLGAERLEYSASGDPALAAHVTVLPRMGQAVTSASGKRAEFSGQPFTWTGGAAGEWIELAGVRLVLPPRASVRWPVLPHNPYRKDGRAGPEEGRLVIDLPPGAPARLVVQVGR